MKPTARHRARKCAIQAIYSWQLSGNNITNVEIDFLFEHDMSNVDVVYFSELLKGVSNHILDLDKKMAPYLSRQICELDQIEKAVLRLAMFELCYRDDIPYKVTINEAIELAKIFGAQESYKFINGALDKVVSTVCNAKN
ncbi:N utilization substance protein B [Candidatus Arsenophonus lipoptenae]|uniref:Transcription antitermination protein NusB n=1 Tax=Candidatus Arsenophonus lipoptenae TaxID=634113 RepID=A0A0X9WAB6_9GAMM|nr:transcription antitermination factor NusB [Candidatus Arsenophonus lipoptenae]AMA64823.1 N utilization substance protein B [Candidatus Arsenophonus lipoptenae]